MYNSLNKKFSEIIDESQGITICTKNKTINCKGITMGGFVEHSDIAMWFDLLREELLLLVERVPVEDEDDRKEVESFIEQFKHPSFTAFVKYNSDDYADITVIKSNIYDNLGE